MRQRPTTAYAHAHCAVTAALARGDLPPPTVCEACGESPQPRQRAPRFGIVTRLTSQMVYHHHDYLLPLDVIALCRSCHQRVHIGQIPEPRTGRMYPRQRGCNNWIAAPALNADASVSA